MPIITHDFFGGSMPFFHGSSNVYLDSIRQYGLGGRNILEEWHVKDAFRIAYEWVEKNRPKTTEILYEFEAIMREKPMWRYGQTYITSCLSRATCAREHPFGELVYKLKKMIDTYEVPYDEIPQLSDLYHQLDLAKTNMSEDSCNDMLLLQIAEVDYDEVRCAYKELEIKVPPVDPVEYLLGGLDLVLIRPIPFERMKIMNLAEEKESNRWLQQCRDRLD